MVVVFIFILIYKFHFFDFCYLISQAAYGKQEVHGNSPHGQGQHLTLTQPAMVHYRGGSLPNVNQMSNNSIDLQVNYT